MKDGKLATDEARMEHGEEDGRWKMMMSRNMKPEVGTLIGTNYHQ